jgi:hypothetical protein
MTAITLRILAAVAAAAVAALASSSSSSSPSTILSANTPDAAARLSSPSSPSSHVLSAYPPVGARLSFTPTSNVLVGMRHCEYVCSADQPDGTEDFVFVVAAPRNGDSSPASVTFTSANFPDHALSINQGGKIGVNTNPDADDATWTLTPGLTDATNWTLVTQSKNPAYTGFVLTLNSSETNPCAKGDDIALLAPGAPSALAQTWRVAGPPPPPPPPPSTVTVAAGTVTGTLAPTINACHSDEGFMHQPQSFLSQMVYGEAFETTNGMMSGWSVQTDPGAQGTGALDPTQRFAAAARPSFHLSYASGTGNVRLAHRGMGNEGLVFQAGKDYEGYIFAKANTATSVTVTLRDYVGGTVLASAVLSVPGGGAWTQLPYTLTPSGSTNCVGITSDPDISCDNGGFADYICIKCGGELSYGLSSPGDIWVGYARLEPGTWGRFAGLPVRADAIATLKSMGVSAVRYGGSVGSSVSWKDFRGPVWNRTSLGRTWVSSDMSGWGPFDAMDAFAAAGISVTVTMSDSDPPSYWADLVEYAIGDADTTWGALRIADGHPAPYEPLAWELGNEQYNSNFVAQVQAMEARAASIGKTTSWAYMFPDNS